MISLTTIRPFVAFAALTDEQCIYIATHAAELHLDRGGYATYEGEAPAFFFILSGVLELTKRIGRVDQVIDTRTEGDHFGEVPILMGTAFPISARATGIAHVLRLTAQDFRLLLADLPDFARTITGAMVRSINGLQSLAISIPASRVTLICNPWDSTAFAFRDFLARNQVLFSQEVPVAVKSTLALPANESFIDSINARLADGTMLINPSQRELALKLGMQTEPRYEVYDLAVVGGGPAGLSAAVYASSEGLKTLVIERAAPGGQAGTSSRIENYLGFPVGIAGDDLGRRAFDQAVRLGADVVVTREALELRTNQLYHELVLDGDQVIQARTVLLATGVDWRRLSVPAIDQLLGCGVFYGAAKTEAVNARDKDIYLVGGGNSAGQTAMFFANYARTVTLLVRSGSLASTMSQYLINQLKSKPNIQIDFHREVTGVEGDKNLEAIQIANILTNETQRNLTNTLIILIGADARTNWLPKTIGLDNEGFILTGRDVQNQEANPLWSLKRDPFYLETSVPGVFAAGDVRSGSTKRVASSVGEGGVAVASIHAYFTSLLAANHSFHVR